MSFQVLSIELYAVSRLIIGYANILAYGLTGIYLTECRFRDFKVLPRALFLAQNSVAVS